MFCTFGKGQPEHATHQTYEHTLFQSWIKKAVNGLEFDSPFNTLKRPNFIHGPRNNVYECVNSVVKGKAISRYKQDYEEGEKKTSVVAVGTLAHTVFIK